MPFGPVRPKRLARNYQSLSQTQEHLEIQHSITVPFPLKVYSRDLIGRAVNQDPDPFS